MFEQKLEEQIVLFNSRQDEQTALMEERFEQAFTRQQEAQLSLKEYLEGIKSSLQPLVDKAEAEAKAAALAAEKAAALKRNQAEAKRVQAEAKRVQAEEDRQFNYYGNDYYSRDSD